MSGLDVVTGAFSYTGAYIARRLLAEGRRVRTLSRRPSPEGSPIEAAPLEFEDPEGLAASLEQAATLYNTYWIRFPRGGRTFEEAVTNTETLLRAAAEAGVERVVHISVSNPREDSPLPYFRGKAAAERAVRESGIPYAIVRPTLVFGREDVLVNNIGWILRRSPLFLVPGRGDYSVQPVAVEDVAEIAVAAAEGEPNVTIDAAGPETLTFEELVRLVGSGVGSRARITRSSPRLALRLTALLGAALRDVVLTREELAGLMANLLVSAEAPRGQRSFRRWVEENGEMLGRRYVSELARNWRRAPL